VDLSHRLALPHHPSRRGAVGILFIRIDHTCPRAPLWLAPCLIPACGCADDAQLSVLCTLPFWALRVLCVRAGAAFFGAVRWVHTMLPPLPSLFASAAMHLLRNECKSPSSSSCVSGSAVKSVHACEAAMAATSPYVCTSSVSRTSCISCAGRRRWTGTV
jgi:hypothetical protein